MAEATKDDLDVYREAIRAWLPENLPARDPNAGLRGGHEITPKQVEADRATQKKVCQAGYMGISWPKEYGGQGLTRKHERIWAQESAGYAVPMPGGIASSVTIGLIAPTLMAHASEEQKRAWLPKILSGEEIWCQLLSEPAAGSDLAGILTRATRDGDNWLITGNKVWSSGAMEADFGICLARTDWDATKHRGLTWFKVPLHDERVTVRPVREINGSAEFCEEFLDDVVVADDMRIGDVNGGWPIANTMLAFERGAGGDHTPPRSKGRRRLAPDLVKLARGRGIAGEGRVRQMIAKAHTNDYMQGQLTARIITAIARGEATPTSASYIKLGTGIIEPLRAIAAMELAGRRGVAWREDDFIGLSTSTNYLNGRIMSIAGGSNQIQRNIIGERELGLPREPSADSNKPFNEVQRDAKNWGKKPA